MNTTERKNSVYQHLLNIDRILRGEATRGEHLSNADIPIPILGVSVTIAVLAAIYGFCMGVFALVRGFENAAYSDALMQTCASICKVPCLFVLTLIVTFPSLYVFNALAGSRLRIFPVLKLLVASLAVNITVLASMGPILAFFSLSTPNYPFIVILNVIVFAVAGLLGLSFLIQTLGRLTHWATGRVVQTSKSTATATKDSSLTKQTFSSPQSSPQSPSHVPPNAEHVKQSSPPTDGPLDRPLDMTFDKSVWRVFYCWLAVFCLVGCQMGWVLRPFIGSPGKPFEWFRARESNFFEAVFQLIF